jgi:hypothetical protein
MIRETTRVGHSAEVTEGIIIAEHQPNRFPDEIRLKVQNHGS